MKVTFKNKNEILEKLEKAEELIKELRCCLYSIPTAEVEIGDTEKEEPAEKVQVLTD